PPEPGLRVREAVARVHPRPDARRLAREARSVDGPSPRLDLLRGQRGGRHAVLEAVARIGGAAQVERLLVRDRALRHRPRPDARADADADAVPEDRRLADAGPRDELGAPGEGARLRQ